MNKKISNKAFTLIELLVVISIISLLASILLPKLQQARAKADDVRRKAVLKNIQSQIIGDKADATTNFSDIFSSGSKAKDMLDTLISQTGVSSTDYDAKVSSDGTSYAVVFPLKADPTKYWCVDSTGVSKEVGGRLTANGSLCGNVVASGGNSSSNAPVITMLTGHIIVSDDMEFWCKRSIINPSLYDLCIGNREYAQYDSYKDWLRGVSVYDQEDGNLTTQIRQPLNGTGNGYQTWDSFYFSGDMNTPVFEGPDTVGSLFNGFQLDNCSTESMGYYFSIYDSNGNVTHSLRYLLHCDDIIPPSSDLEVDHYIGFDD